MKSDRSDLAVGMSLGAVLLGWGGPTLLEGIPALVFLTVLVLLALDSWGPTWYTRNRWLRSPGLLALSVPAMGAVCANLSSYPLWPSVLLVTATLLLAVDAVTHQGWKRFGEPPEDIDPAPETTVPGPASGPRTNLVAAGEAASRVWAVVGLSAAAAMLPPGVRLPLGLGWIWLAALLVLGLNLQPGQLPEPLRRPRVEPYLVLAFTTVGVLGLSFSLPGALLGAAVFLALKECQAGNERNGFDPTLCWHGGAARRCVFIGAVLAALALNSVWESSYMSAAYRTTSVVGGWVYETRHAPRTFEGSDTAYASAGGVAAGLLVVGVLLSLTARRWRPLWRGLPVAAGAGFLYWGVDTLVAQNREMEETLAQGLGVTWGGGGPALMALAALFMLLGGVLLKPAPPVDKG